MAALNGNGTVSAVTLPLFAMFLGIGTCAFVVGSHMVKGREPAYPTVSMCAFRPASLEYYIFAYGLCTCASLIMVTGFLIRWRFWEQRTTWLAMLAYLASNVGAVGLAVTSIVPLQPDIMEVLALPRAKRKLSLQSNIHSTGAQFSTSQSRFPLVCHACLRARRSWPGTAPECARAF